MQKIIIIIFLFLVGCINKKEQTGTISESTETITIPPVDINSEMSISTFVESIDVIPLEFNDFCILGEIEKVVIEKENVFVIEKRAHRPKTVYRFNRSGDFINTIGVYGQGPEEIVDLKDFSVDEVNQTIYLYDCMMPKINEYTFDGKFIRSVKVDYYAERMEYANGIFYLNRDNPNIGELFSLVIKDAQSGVTVEQYIPVKPHIFTLTNRFFCKKKDEILCYKSYCDTVFSIKNSEITKAFITDFMDFKMNPDEIEDIYMGKIRELDLLMSKDRMSRISDLFYTGKWVYFNSIRLIISCSFLYNTETKELFESGRLADDLYYMFSDNSFYGQTEDELIGLYYPENIESDLDRYNRFEKEKRITPQQRDMLVKKMKAHMRGDNPEEMNPWILLYNLKK